MQAHRMRASFIAMVACCQLKITRIVIGSDRPWQPGRPVTAYKLEALNTEMRLCSLQPSDAFGGIRHTNA